MIKEILIDGHEFREVLPGIFCSRDGRFYGNGRFYKLRRQIRPNGNHHVAQIFVWNKSIKKQTIHTAAILVAKAWIYGYKEGDGIIYKDGDQHNVKYENLILMSHDNYIRKLNQIRTKYLDCSHTKNMKIEILENKAKTCMITADFLRTGDWNPVHEYIKNDLLPYLYDYCNRRGFGQSKAEKLISESVCRLYDKLYTGYGMSDYRKFCKEIIYGIHTGKNIYYGCTSIHEDFINDLKLDSLWKKFKKTRKHQK